jgi:hypothetical protein
VRVERRLAAIPAADVAGRSRLLGEYDELVFTSPTYTSPAIECLSPELALPITASGWQHF